MSREYEAHRDPAELHPEADLERTFYEIIIEREIEDTEALDEETVEELLSMPGESYLRTYFEEWGREYFGVPDDEGYQAEFREHLFCDFYRKYHRRREKEMPVEKAVAKTQRKSVRGLESLFNCHRSEIAEVPFVNEVADVFRKAYAHQIEPSDSE